MVEQHIRSLIPEAIKKQTFIGSLPSSPVNAIAIIVLSGATNIEYFDDITVYTPVIKIVIRNQSYGKGRQYATEIIQKLHRYHDDYFYSIVMQGYVNYLGKDEQNLHEFQLVFSTKIKE